MACFASEAARFTLQTTLCFGEPSPARVRGASSETISTVHTHTTTHPRTFSGEVIASYNVDVEAEKQFVVGSVNGISTDTILLENEEAEPHLAVIDKLVEKCGGFITFSFNASGQREINWVAELSYRNKQLIEFGSNLMDFSRTMANTDLATRIIPYGAKNESTGERLTIKSVNNELDFIQDDEAVALRGVITKAVYF